MSLSLTENQRLAITVTERINSGLSLVGIFFILTTFMFSSSFNKPINRLIFFASWGNIGSNVAGLISETGLTGSMALCQAQAFLVQMFLGVDCCWAICMAINVYLIFFRGYTIEQLRPLDVRYLVACYGLSFIPAIVFCFISTKDLGQLYGPALIWCWISPKWDWVRLVALYSVAWVAIIIASVVYIMAGRVIWSKRKYLDGFLNPLNENPFTSIVTTEIEITHEDRSILKDTESHGMSDLPSNIDPYSVTVRVETPCREPTLPPALRIRSLTRNAAKSEPNAEAWLYARVAVLFFIALLITWSLLTCSGYLNDQRTTLLNFVMSGICEKYHQLKTIATYLCGGILKSLGDSGVLTEMFEFS
ncbi:hypothetical protein G7Y89_g385 [Cudoniella acicularis]|uniref:G-protein coupled receptors family 2 profile 2 domain-containing protein n=1 Tax=Cudoniella acicularis TaxID=354080 RepID=A0A8H4RZA2_9HELO|nr:hypothetical protein G7Y89_g385 [Cudoniella acicularis]